MTTTSLPTLRWPAVQKDADDVYSVELSVFSLCAAFWRANEQYASGDFAWPNVTIEDGAIVKGANGYVYQCTQAGRSASKEPRWTTVADIALPALDGSVQWTPRIGGLQGIQVVSAPVVTSIGPTTELTVSDIVVSEGTKLLLDYSGGILNKDYTVEFEFSIAGRTRVGRQIVQIRQI